MIKRQKKKAKRNLSQIRRNLRGPLGVVKKGFPLDALFRKKLDLVLRPSPPCSRNGADHGIKNRSVCVLKCVLGNRTCKQTRNWYQISHNLLGLKFDPERKKLSCQCWLKRLKSGRGLLDNWPTSRMLNLNNATTCVTFLYLVFHDLFSSYYL